MPSTFTTNSRTPFTKCLVKIQSRGLVGDILTGGNKTSATSGRDQGLLLMTLLVTLSRTATEQPQQSRHLNMISNVTS